MGEVSFSSVTVLLKCLKYFMFFLVLVTHCKTKLISAYFIKEKI